MQCEKPTQEDLKRFVQNNIGSCQSSLVDKLLSDGVFDYDEIVNGYVFQCEKCGDKMDELEDDDEFTIYKCINCEHTTREQPEQELQEIYEWWVINSWLARKLKEQGQPVLENDYGTWWGRTCTGQAIALDSVIETIITSKIYA